MSTTPSVERFVVGPVSTNCYLVEGRYVIDPGGWNQELESALTSASGRLEAILLTHAHYDHISAINRVHELVPNCPVYCHSEDVEMLRDPDRNLSIWGGSRVKYEASDVIEDQTWPLPQGELEVLHTPGHTPGSVSLYWQKQGICFVGDTLFKRGIGRTDIPGGSQSRLITSIREHILSLPEDTRVLPGHGPETSVRMERDQNPFL